MEVALSIEVKKRKIKDVYLNRWNPILAVWEWRREVIWWDLMDCGDDDGVG